MAVREQADSTDHDSQPRPDTSICWTLSHHPHNAEMSAGRQKYLPAGSTEADIKY